MIAPSSGRALARRGGGLVCASLLGSLALACLTPEDPPGSRYQKSAAAVGYWVAHISGGAYDPYIQLLSLHLSSDSTAPIVVNSLPTRDFNGDPAPILVPEGSGGPVPLGLQWNLLSPGGTTVLHVQTVGDTMLGTLTTDSAGQVTLHQVVGFRISPLILPVPDEPPPGVLNDSVPLVLLRFDDDPPADTIVLPRVMARGLYGELSIPTALVGTDRPGWGHLDTMVADGFTLAAHSRLHATTAGSTLELLREVLGSLGNLAERGHSTRVFVQPGTWSDSMNFQSPASLRNWRGALFQTFTEVLEAYARDASVSVPVPDSIAIGLGHETISDGASKSVILQLWRIAQRRDHFITFLVHSYNVQPPDTLDWFFDSISVAVKQGRVRLARSSADALAP